MRCPIPPTRPLWEDALNYTLEAPIPYLIVAQLVVGQELLETTGGNTSYVNDRLYVQMGSLLKFNKGSGLDVVNTGASLNVGSRSYINGFDQSSSYGPGSASFAQETANDPPVVFTSIFDDAASTPFVPALNAFKQPSTTTLAPGLWGSVGILTGAVTVINDATFQYGGGAVNTQQFTIPSQSVLAFISGITVATFPLPPTWDPANGTHAYITNDNFYNNFDAAMQIEPDGLLAADPLHPLASGHPFFRNNVMTGNGIDGLSVVTDRVYLQNAAHELQLCRTGRGDRPIRVREPDGQRRLGFDGPHLRPPGHGGSRLGELLLQRRSSDPRHDRVHHGTGTHHLVDDPGRFAGHAAGRWLVDSRARASRSSSRC